VRLGFGRKIVGHRESNPFGPSRYVAEMGTQEMRRVRLVTVCYFIEEVSDQSTPRILVCPYGPLPTAVGRMQQRRLTGQHGLALVRGGNHHRPTDTSHQFGAARYPVELARTVHETIDVDPEIPIVHGSRSENHRQHVAQAVDRHFEAEGVHG
jgi:hypothetical protein